MRLDPDFSEFIACCAAREVRFLIVGGYTLAPHGAARQSAGGALTLFYGSVSGGVVLAPLAIQGRPDGLLVGGPGWDVGADSSAGALWAVRGVTAGAATSGRRCTANSTGVKGEPAEFSGLGGILG
jgi:hypothetical protein